MFSQQVEELDGYIVYLSVSEWFQHIVSLKVRLGQVMVYGKMMAVGVVSPPLKKTTRVLF
jgi:hypothetical protein